MQERCESIGRLVSILHRSGQVYLGKRLEPYGIGYAQLPFLAELFGQDGVSQDDLAAGFQCDKATSTRALQRLEQQGYVERKRSAEDGRVNLVYLTPKAREIEEILFDVLSGWTELLAQGLSASERKQLIRLLNRLVENTTGIKENGKTAPC